MAAEPYQKIFCQDTNIAFAFAQRRNMKFVRIEMMPEIRAKTPAFAFFLDILICCGNNSYIRCSRFLVADTAKRFCFNKFYQLLLKLQMNNYLSRRGKEFRHLRVPPIPSFGRSAGENVRSLYPKIFRLEPVFRNRAAVDNDVRFLFP